MSVVSARASLRHPVMAVVITCLVCFYVLAVYLHGPLQGNFNQFFLPAKMFGVPADLRSHGIHELFLDDKNSGWDGQFYYYIANDLFARKDTLQHIDGSAYRYQRIGLPLLANVVSKITLRSWVNPFTYYLTSLLVVLAAVGMVAAFFQSRGLSAYWALLWALGLGTQVTQLNGLPDAAADGFLIIALVSLFQGRQWLYVITMVFAVLAREVYVLIPAFMIVGLLIQSIPLRGIRGLLKKIGIHLIPIAIWGGWQIFIRMKFGVSPSSQADHILGWPLNSTFHYLRAGLNGIHSIVGVGVGAYLEGMGILLYLVLLILSAISLYALLRKSRRNSPFSFGIALGFLVMIAMYLCFGSTVMMHHTGYFKAANIFLFLIPFVASLNHHQLHKLTASFLIGITLFFGYLLWGRVAGAPYFSDGNIVYAIKEPSCLKDYRAKVTPLSVEVVSSNSLMRRIFVDSSIIVHTEIVNRSSKSFSPYPGKGSVNVSYHWLNRHNLAVVKDGDRTRLNDTLKPNQKTIVPVVVKLLTKPGEYILKLTLVQEGCSWFYMVNPDSSFNIFYTVR